LQIRLGTRASALARWQAEWVAARLQELGVDVAMVPIATTGDRRQGPIGDIGGQGLFTKEIERALLDDRIDLAVHSLKDLPTGLTPGLVLAAVPERGPVGDVLLMRRDSSAAAPDGASYVVCDLSSLPQGATVGTGSLRRRAQLLHVRPDLVMKDIRGNVETRLRKLVDGHFDVLILAEAGLRRLGLLTDKGVGSLYSVAGTAARDRAADLLLPAVGQGALGLETRENDAPTRTVVARLDHWPTHLAVLAERAMLASLQGGCLAPVAALAIVEGAELTLVGRVLSHDGRTRLNASGATQLAEGAAADAAACENAERLGRDVAELLRNQGADRLIGASRHA
jgi:hydroxymethylbilane synthase